MNIKDTIKQIIRQFQTTELPNICSRNVLIPTDTKKILTIIGVRRCGKTFLLFDIIKKLVNDGVPIDNILYLNFEDERLHLRAEDLDLIIQSWRELHNGQLTENHYFFFDEIQNISKWEKFIRRLYDNETRHIFITGSNSAFLSTDIASSLRGRNLAIELFPFDFAEYIRFKNITPDYYEPSNRARIINELNNFILKGSFPELIGKDSFFYYESLRTYYYVMLYKDLIERYRISSPGIIKFFIEKFADNLSKGFSINKIYNTLRSMGLSVDKNMLYDLMEYIQNIYLAFQIECFDYSLASRKRSNKKVYFIDNGLINIINPQWSENKGKLFENSVYLFLRKNYGSLFEKNIYYFKKKQECDFIVFDSQKPMYCIQAAFSISDDETLHREVDGLIEAMNYFSLKTGIILTAEQEDELNVNDKKILIKPAYKVFINNEIKI